MTPTGYVLTALGAALLAFALWERLGRSRNARAWLRSPRAQSVRNTLVVRPGLGVCLLVLGLFPLVSGSTALAALVGLVGAAALALTFWWGILAFPHPAWVVPSYARGRLAREQPASEQPARHPEEHR